MYIQVSSNINISIILLNGRATLLTTTYSHFEGGKNRSCQQSSCSCQYNCHEAPKTFPLPSASQKMQIILFNYLCHCGFAVVLSTLAETLYFANHCSRSNGCGSFYKLIFIYTIYTDSVRTSQETHYVSATETNWLILFRETVAVYCENHMQYINTMCWQNTDYVKVKAGGAYCYECDLNGIIV
jgi:hypothetical protein